jgi:cephalosporin-C deacetylase-like acetyl esterase
MMLRLSLILAVALVAAVATLGVEPKSSFPIRPVPPQADFRVAVARIVVAPDDADWTYKVGEPVKFRVSVTADNTPIEGAAVSYAIGPEYQPVEWKTAVVPTSGLELDGGTMQVPGFLRCKVVATIGGKEYVAMATAAFSPEKIEPYAAEPEDFDAFWATGREALAKVPLESRLTPMHELSTEHVDTYHVRIRTIGEGWYGHAYVYGILNVPKKPGRYPAVLKVPGAGVRPYSGDAGLAAKGAIVLEIGVHGLPVNLAKEVYDVLLAGALNNYWTFNMEDRESFYYRRVILSSLRSVDFLAAHPAWNGKDIIVMGASQGGMLAIDTAALDSRVTALQATHPAMCDLVAPLHGRAGGWPQTFQPNDDGSSSRHATPAKIRTAGYYDTVNFARRVKVPGFYIWGYNDEACPPSSTHAAYNVITAPKTLAIELEQQHSYPEEQNLAIYEWVERTLGLR